jgi:hypothetical protein
MALVEYAGNIPSNVVKDAKYSVVHDGEGGMEIRLIYRFDLRQEALLTTRSHQQLVEKVNAVKEEAEGVPGGAFYINEYGHVLVPALGQCWFAGEYEDLLEFSFQGSTIGPEPPPDLEPGDYWEGPHVGIRHKITVDGDLGYVVQQGNIRTTHVLSDIEPSARRLVERLSPYKGGSGRVYINECRVFFAPVPEEDRLAYVYLGRLEEEDPWFPCPEI